MSDDNRPNVDNYDENEGKYWWILPLLGFLLVVGFMMGELAFFAALP